MRSLTMLIQRDWCPMCGGHGGWGMAGMSFFWIFVLAALVAIAWRFMRQRPLPAGNGPEEVLRTRFARGEIDRTTYDQMLIELRKDAPR